MRRPFYFPVIFIGAGLFWLGLAPLTYSQLLPPDLIIKPVTSNGDTLLDTIYQYSSGLNPRTVTMGLRIGTQGDSVQQSVPIDVLFACDLSGSMWEGAIAGHNILYWVQVSAMRFIDSLRNLSSDRAAILGWTGNMDFRPLALADSGNPSRFIKRIFPFSNDMTAARTYVRDSLLCDWLCNPPGPPAEPNYVPGNEFIAGNTPNVKDFPGCSRDTPRNVAMMVALNYLKAYGDPTHVKVLILLTDGANTDAVASSLVVTQAGNLYASDGILTYAIGFNAPNQADLTQIVTAGHGQYYSTASPAQLDSIFMQIKRKITSVVATAISTGAPLLNDVLPPQLNYVAGTEAAAPGNTVTATFTTATVGAGLTQLNWAITQVVVRDSIARNYQMSGNTPGFWDVHVTKAVNATYYSRAYFNNFNGNLRDKEFPAPHKIFVLNAPGPEDISIDAAGGDRQVSVTVDVSRLTYSAARTVFLYWSATGYVTNPASAPNDTSFSYATLAIPGQNTVTIPNLASNTLYYFTVSFDNTMVPPVQGIINIGQNGDTARTTANQNIPGNYLNLAATATATDSITLSFANSNIFDNDIVQIGIWWSTTGYLMDPLARAPDRLLNPATGSVFPAGPFNQAIYLGGLLPSTVYYFTVSNKNSDNWAVIGAGAYPRNRDTARTLDPVFRDTLRMVYIREQGATVAAGDLIKTMDDIFTLESRGNNLDVLKPKDWGLAGAWSYSGFGGATVPVPLNTNDSVFTFRPGGNIPATPDTGYIIFTYAGTDTSDGQFKTLRDSVRIILLPGAPAAVHITTQSLVRAGMPQAGPSLSVGPNLVIGGVVDTLVGVYFDRFGNYTGAIPPAANGQWSIYGSGASMVAVNPAAGSSTQVLKADNLAVVQDSAFCVLTVSGQGSDTTRIGLLKSEVAMVVFTLGNPTLAEVTAAFNTLAAETSLTVYTGVTGYRFTAWARLQDSSIMPLSVSWQITTARNQSAYNNQLQFSGGQLLVSGDYKWASAAEDRIVVLYPANISVTQGKWLVVKPGLPWVAVAPPDSAVSADAGPVLDLKLPTTDYGVAGQWYTTLPVTVTVHIKVLNNTGGVVYETDVPVNFIGGQGTYSLPGINIAGAYTVIVSGTGLILDPYGNVFSRSDTTGFTIKAGAPFQGRVAWLPGSTRLFVPMAEVTLGPGQDSASTSFQLYLYDQFGNGIDSVPGFSTGFGAPAVWYHDGVRIDSVKTHWYGVGLATPNDTVTVTAYCAGITASILVRQILPVHLRQVAFFDADLDGRVDSLRLSFSDLAEVEGSSLQFSGLAFGAGEVQVASGSGAVRDTLWIVRLAGARLGYGTGRIPPLDQLTDPNGATFLTDSVRYADRAAPAIISFEIVPTHCGENLERDRVTAVFSEKVWVRQSSGLPAVFVSVDTKDLLFALFEVYDEAGVQRNPWSAECGALRQAGGCPALYPNIFDEVGWQNATDSVVAVNLVSKRVRGHNLLADVSRLGFKRDSAYYISDSAKNRLAFLPDGSHARRAVLKLGAGGAVSVACQVSIVNTGSAAATAGVVRRDPVTGAVTYIGSGYAAGMTYVEARDIDRNMLFAPLAEGAAIDPAILTDPARRDELRQLLLLKKLGFYADIIVYDLIGQVTDHISFAVLPTDFVNEASLAAQVEVVLATNLYQQTVNYDYASLNEEAKKKLLGWDFRNDKGRPVAKGAYLMRMFFRNSWVTRQEETNRQLVFEGPVVHK
jgi:hypothetical protein